MVAEAASPTSTPSKGTALRELQFAGASTMWRAFADTLRPPERLTPSQFSEKHIVLDPSETEQPGPWSNDYFPYLGPIMDTIAEALRAGKQGWVMMKSAQGGGSRAVQNVLAWMLGGDFSGAIAYMINKDELARLFSLQRFQPMIRTCAPLARKHIRRGSNLHHQRFTDGSINMSGSAISNLQSLPYRFFVLDEIDSLMDELKDGSDPIKLALQRMKSFFGPTLLLAFAHPSTLGRGAAKLFYALSDQRRGFVVCPHCAHEFWLQWSHVIAFPKEGMNKQQAELDPGCYEYHCPECSCEISDSQRIAMVRQVKYRSELSPEEAARRPWVGCHFSQLYMPNQTIRGLAAEYCACKSESEKRVFFNKVLGEPYETTVDKVEATTWRNLIYVPRPGKYSYRGTEFKNDPEAYVRGQVPPGVRFLTAGQDSKQTEFHYSVWGWGLRRIFTHDTPTEEQIRKFDVHLCGWLIDWGVLPREKSPIFTQSEYHVFDNILFRQWYPATYSDEAFQVALAGFDVGYAPTQIPIHAFCRYWPRRAVPMKGAALTATAASKAPPVKWGLGLRWELPGEDPVRDDSSRPLIANTFLLKTDLYGALLQRFKTMTCHGVAEVGRITLPMDVDDRFIEECSNEYLTKDEDGVEVWEKKGPNHFADTAMESYGCALNLDPFQEGLPFEEVQAAEDEAARKEAERRAAAGERPPKRPLRTKY